MKKLLVFSMLLVSFVSYGQINNRHSNYYQDNFSITGGGLTNGAFVDLRINRWGIGVDTRTTNDGHETISNGLYYITPTHNGWDLIIGGGIFMDRETIVTGYHFDYYGYLTNLESVATSHKIYGIVGINKDIPICKFGDDEFIGITIRGMVRALPIGVEPAIGFGIKMNFPSIRY